MARLQVVSLPGDRFGLVLDEVEPDDAATLKDVQVDRIGAEVVLAFQFRVELVP